jgi:hypothetical protein
MTAATGSPFERTESREVRGLAAEVKFLVSPADARRIRDWARATLAPDPFGAGAFADEYRTTSLYFDTAALDVFNRRGSYGRAKYRVRRYGNADRIFLERKLRTSSLLAKRRTAIALDDLPLVADDNPAAPWNWSGDWFQQRLAARRLEPACEVSYMRTARIGTGVHGPVRLTLDEQLRALPASGLQLTMDRGRDVLSDAVILELKFRQSLPSMFKALIEQFNLAPQPVSKYRFSMAALRGVDLQPARPVGSRLVRLAVA